MNQEYSPYGDIVKSFKKTIFLKRMTNIFKFLILIGLPYVIVSSMFVDSNVNVIQIVSLIGVMVAWVFSYRAYNHSNMISKIWIWLEDTKAKKGTVI